MTCYLILHSVLKPYLFVLVCLPMKLHSNLRLFVLSCLVLSFFLPKVSFQIEYLYSGCFPRKIKVFIYLLTCLVTWLHLFVPLFSDNSSDHVMS